MTIPRKGSVEGLHGLPLINGKTVRVFVDGDMPRGVISWDIDQGWADVMVWGDCGEAVTDGEHIISRRVFGKIEVKAL